MNQKQKLGNPRTETCQYCKGTGYHQLLLGGSETCDHCGGSGRKHT
ncbi:YuiA family protein [Pseudalkalibacillus decolorationis]|nr:YuiA family protein [Pseudalkalibacillus decolorationis]